MQEKLLGLSTWLKMAFEQEDFSPFIEYLLERARQDEADAAALIDLSTIYYLLGNDDLAYQIQRQALQQQQVYELSSTTSRPQFTALILKTEGDFKANWPIELLLDTSKVGIKIAYVGANIPWMGDLPEHDIVINAIALSDDNLALIEATEDLFDEWPRNTINPPSALLACQNLKESLDKIQSVVFANDSKKEQLQVHEGCLHRYRVFAVGQTVTPFQVVISTDMTEKYHDIDLDNNQQLRELEQQLLNQFVTDIQPSVQVMLIKILNSLTLDCGVIEFALTTDNQICLFEVESAPLIHDYENVDKFAYRAKFITDINHNLMSYLSSRII